MKMHFIDAPNEFYLGAAVNPETGQVVDDATVYYDARDLTTHGIILGMTGSGKTGLAVTLLEEAVLDGIPMIIIDPKGDITNMCLAFPELTAEHFQPWVNPEDATRANRSMEEHAKAEAEKWAAGLEEWGITNDRIQQFRRASRYSIYTPGSDAGLPISILQSFAAPKEGWVGNEEALRERISGIVSALLALIGVNAKPLEDREHILMTNLFEYNWKNGVDLSMEQLILQVQRPPFSKLGVFEVETLFAEKDRFKLAQKLNNILATPSFQNWIQGEPLHIPSLLYTPEGQPRTSIIYVAHLNDQERQFIITLILQGVLAWMRTLTGTTSLRAMIYIDEVFGMFPPYPRNPVTKEPILRLLKQARAFGIGMMLATQNPADLDYKGLSNAGTWFIGKLQTDNDKNRVLEGLDSARDATSALDIKTVADTLGKLGRRQFIMHNIHEVNTPILMQSRFSMSYLRGPLARDQIMRLMANQRGARPTSMPSSPTAMPQSEPLPSYMAPPPRSATEPKLFELPSEEEWGAEPTYYTAPEIVPEPTMPASSRAMVPRATYSMEEAEQPKEEKLQAPPGFKEVPPALPAAVQQYYLPTEFAVEQSVQNWERWTGQRALNINTKKRLLYRPSLLAQVQLRFDHKASMSSQVYWYAFVVPNLPKVPYLNWSEFQSEPFDPQALDHHPFSASTFYGDVPQTLTSASGFKSLQANLVDWLYTNAKMSVYYNPALKMYSGLNEDRRDYVSRLQGAARDARDNELDTVAQKYDKRLSDLEGKAQIKSLRLESQRSELEGRKREELLSGGESVWRLMKGNTYRTLSRAGELRRIVGQAGDRVGIMEQELMEIADRLERTEREMEDSLNVVKEKWTQALQRIEEIPVIPLKKDISFILFGIGWVPYWDVELNGQSLILPASSSGLTQAQDPSLASGGGARYY